MLYEVTSFLSEGASRRDIVSLFHKQSYVVYSSFNMPYITRVTDSNRDIILGITVPYSGKIKNDKFVYQIEIAESFLNNKGYHQNNIVEHLDFNLIKQSLKNNDTNRITSATCRLMYHSYGGGVARIDCALLLPSGLPSTRHIDNPNVRALKE